MDRSRPGQARSRRKSDEDAEARDVWETRQASIPSRAHRGGPLLKVPIALKFTGFIAVLVVAFMAWQTYTATRAATHSLEGEVNRGGIELVTSLSSAIEPDCFADGEGHARLLRALGELTHSTGTERILNVVVEDTRGPIATARGESQFFRTEGHVVEDAAASTAGVEIHEFRYEGMPVRSFARQIPPRSPPGRVAAEAAPPPGRVEVYLSARSIEESRRRLATAMLGVTVAACGLAAVGSFLLASYLAAPIRALEKDMKQVSLGNLEHKSMVRSSDELGRLAHAFNTMTESLQAAQEAKVAQKSLEYELALASQIQARLLPAQTPEMAGFEVAVHYAAAKEVSGDYYDFVRVDDRRLGVVVGDVSGKGVPAALVMTMTRSLLRIAAREQESPARTLELVNRFLTPDLKRGLFVTLLYYILEPSRSEIHLARAGHNAPLYFKAQDRTLARIQPRGIAVGLDRQGALFESELKVQRLALGAGDVLVAYTDGVVEAKDREQKEYTEERLGRVVASCAERSAHDLVAAIVVDVERHRHGQERSDDMTIVALRRL